jgi:acyl-CoA reductase-like NAD-dependent aldehyde dehydrogenase
MAVPGRRLGGSDRLEHVAGRARRIAMKIRCDRMEMVEKLGVIAGIVPSNSPKPIL